MGWGVSTIVKDNFGLVDSMKQYHNNTVLDNFNLQQHKLFAPKVPMIVWVVSSPYLWLYLGLFL